MANRNGNGSKKPDEWTDIPHERPDPRPDFTTPPARKKLPESIQETLDNDEKLLDLVYDGKAEDSTDSSIRYAAYATRIRTIMLSAQRYVAYTSDIGESFRPIAHPKLVRCAYGISWLYLVGDVSHEGYKAYLQNQRILHPELHVDESANADHSITTAKITGAAQKMGEKIGLKAAAPGNELVPGHVSAIEDYRSVMAQRAVFQAVASMGLPAFTIHSIVRYSGRALKDAKNKTIRTWGPIGLGLAAVPFLPFVFDEPVEHATEWIFYNVFKAIGGDKAVEGRAMTGNHHRPGDKVAEKEL